jgi:hypothetical protein
VDNLELMLTVLEDMSQQQTMDHVTGWEAADEVKTTRGLRARSEVLMQMRHALTGQKV